MQKHGHNVMKKAVGGIISGAPSLPPSAVSAIIKGSRKPKGMPMSPITKMKRSNGILGI